MQTSPLITIDPKEFLCEPAYFKIGYSQNPEIKLRIEVVEKLRTVQAKLKELKNYRLKIFDGFRPLIVQEKLYNDTKKYLKKENPNLSEEELKELTHKYAAFPSQDPLSPPPHNSGGAVDLTIVDENNQEVPMGTGFDDFTQKSHPDYFEKEGKDEENAELYRTNRKLFKTEMERVGFVNDPSEWWHFNYGNDAWSKITGEKTIYFSAESGEN